jgi:hypothetical protein
MTHAALQDLYDATEEDLLFGIGLLAQPDQAPAPYIQVHYRNWSREKLEVVRSSFHGGLVLVSGDRYDGRRDLHLSTRGKIVLQSERAGHMSVLRAPAWVARLEGIDRHVWQRFEADRHGYGGFILLVQTRQWEFLTVVDETRGRVIIDPVRASVCQLWKG